MNKKRYFLVAILGLLITTALTTVAAQAAGLGMGGLRGQAGTNNGSSKVQQAIISNDYSTWATAMTTQVADMRQRASDLEAKISEDTFNKLTQAHQLMQAGKTDEAKAIFDELGMFGPMGHMGGKGMGRSINAPLGATQKTE